MTPPLIRSALLGLLPAILAGGIASAGAPAQLDWDRSEDALVLRFEESSDKLVGAPTLRLELWGDGRVVASRPDPYANTGEFEARLSTDEMSAFLQRVARSGFVDFDPARVQDEKRELDRERRAEAAARGEFPPLHYRSEGERILLELNLKKYRAEGGGPPRAVEQRVEWRGLRRDLTEFAGQADLAALAASVEDARVLLARTAPEQP